MRSVRAWVLLSLLVACQEGGQDGGSEVQLLPGPPDAAPPATEPVQLVGIPVSSELSIKEVYRDSAHVVRAVAPDGTLYAIEPSRGEKRLVASTDGGYTFSERGRHPLGASFRVIAALSDGTLLADTLLDSEHSLSRSVDSGATWHDVLDLGEFRLLQGRNIAEQGGEVYLAEYQAFTSVNLPIRFWVSRDRGATWEVRYVFSGVRHAHALVADPMPGALWALMGDTNGGLYRSNDSGHTWSEIVPAPGGVAVDAVPAYGGLIYGRDPVFLPGVPGIVRVEQSGGDRFLAPLPGPCYSMLALRGGGYVLGETREPEGDVYAPEDNAAHLFGSADGEEWRELTAFERVDLAGYGRADTRGQLPGGELVVAVQNVEGFEPTGKGFILFEVAIQPVPR